MGRLTNPFSSVFQFWYSYVRWYSYDVFKTRKNDKRSPGLVAVKTHVRRCRTWLDELSCTYSETSSRRKSCLFFVRARNPAGLALVPCTMRAVDKLGKNKLFTYTFTQSHTNNFDRESCSRGTLPSYCMRSGMKRLLFLENPENMLSAARCARLIIIRTYLEGLHRFIRFWLV